MKSQRNTSLIMQLAYNTEKFNLAYNTEKIIEFRLLPTGNSEEATAVNIY